MISLDKEYSRSTCPKASGDLFLTLAFVDGSTSYCTAKHEKVNPSLGSAGPDCNPEVYKTGDSFQLSKQCSPNPHLTCPLLHLSSLLSSTVCPCVIFRISETPNLDYPRDRPVLF